MTTAKLSRIEREYNEIRNNRSLTARERIDALLAIKTEKRPGSAAIAARQSWLQQELQTRRNRAHCEVTVKIYDSNRSRIEQRPIAQEFFSSAARLSRRNRRLEWRGSEWIREINEARASDADRRAGSPQRLLGLSFAPALVSINDLTASSRTFIRVGEWVVDAVETELVDWNAYSKAWHRAHGPKRTVESRTVRMRRFVGSEIEKRDVAVESWRGNYLLNALLAAGVATATKVAMRLRPVQLHESFEVREIRKIAGVTLYERTLGGERYDYCALWHGLTFHAETPRACVAGLRAKIAAVERKKNATIDFKFCHSLGFCKEGIEQFARDFNLNVRGSYTADEIAAAVRGDLRTASTFVNELKKLADAVGYTIPTEFAL